PSTCVSCSFACRPRAARSLPTRRSSDLSYLSCEQDRLDAVGEAILKAWQKLYTLRDEQRFSTWLTRILIRECIAIQRRQKRTTPDRKSTRLNSSHVSLSYAVFCLKTKTT